jgi:hypothetical protein
MKSPGDRKVGKRHVTRDKIWRREDFGDQADLDRGRVTV